MALFDFPATASGQVMHSLRMLEERIWALEFSKRELEFLHEQNSSLFQQFKDYVSLNLGEAMESFKHALKQVEHFHRLLIILREKIHLGQILQDSIFNVEIVFVM